MGRQIWLCAVIFAGCVRAKVYDITVFVFRRSVLKAAKKAVKRYEEAAGAGEGLRIGGWRVGVPLPGPFRWGDGPVRIHEVWFGPGLQLEWNWLEVRTKAEVQVGTWLRRRLSLKGRVEVCAVCIYAMWNENGRVKDLNLDCRFLCLRQ